MHSTAKTLGNIFFQSINQRSGGFASFDIGQAREHTWLLEDVLMFIGGGSGGTAGGIRVTTLAVLLLAIWAEARGRRDIEAFGKRIGTEVLRLAVSVTLVSLFVGHRRHRRVPVADATVLARPRAVRGRVRLRHVRTQYGHHRGASTRTPRSRSSS